MLNPNAAVFVPGNAQPPGQQPLIHGPAQIAAPALVAPVQQPVVVPGTIVAYANKFDQKHVLPALNASSAVVVGNARGGNIKYSTVFQQAYLEGVVIADASPRNAAGNFTFSIACHGLDPGKFVLAENTNKGWKAIPTPMFFCKIFYTLAIGGGGGKVVTLTHLETDF